MDEMNEQDIMKLLDIAGKGFACATASAAALFMARMGKIKQEVAEQMVLQFCIRLLVEEGQIPAEAMAATMAALENELLEMAKETEQRMKEEDSKDDDFSPTWPQPLYPFLN